MNIKKIIRAEIERRMFEDYNGPDAEQNETAQGVCAGILAFLDTIKETPTWVNRAEQRQKDQANGKKFAIMEIKAEIERRNLANYCGTAEQYEEELFAILDTLPEQPASEEKFRNLLDAMGDCGFSQDNILLLKSIWEDAYGADKKAVKEIVKTVHKEVTRQVKEMVGKQPVEQPEGLHFTPLNRLIQKIPSKNWNNTVNNYAKKLRDCLIKEGYLKDAKILQDYISYMNGNNVSMATMDEKEQSVEGLEEEIASYWNRVTGFQPSLAVLELTKDDLAKVARHFAEWGASHARKEDKK